MPGSSGRAGVGVPGAGDVAADADRECDEAGAAAGDRRPVGVAAAAREGVGEGEGTGDEAAIFARDGGMTLLPGADAPPPSPALASVLEPSPPFARLAASSFSFASRSFRCCSSCSSNDNRIASMTINCRRGILISITRPHTFEERRTYLFQILPCHPAKQVLQLVLLSPPRPPSR